jgi:AcrR family transcriptional regulator
MPSTRHEVDREDKVIEITAAAERQLRDGGYSALSLAAIARELGVAQNSIYWYFPTRDHLFVAVLRKLMTEFPSRKPPASASVSDRAVWIVNRIADWHPLVVAMQERSRSSEVVAEFNHEVEAILRDMIVRVLSPHVSAKELDVAVDAFAAAIEGALLRQLSRRRREAVVRFTLKQFIGARAADSPHR